MCWSVVKQNQPTNQMVSKIIANQNSMADIFFRILFSREFNVSVNIECKIMRKMKDVDYSQMLTLLFPRPTPQARPIRAPVKIGQSLGRQRAAYDRAIHGSNLCKKTKILVISEELIEKC